MVSQRLTNNEGSVRGMLATPEGVSTGLEHGVTPEPDSTAMRTVERGVKIDGALAKYGIGDAAAFFAEVDGTDAESEQ